MFLMVTWDTDMLTSSNVLMSQHLRTFKCFLIERPETSKGFIDSIKQNSYNYEDVYIYNITNYYNS